MLNLYLMYCSTSNSLHDSILWLNILLKYWSRTLCFHLSNSQVSLFCEYPLVVKCFVFRSGKEVNVRNILQEKIISKVDSFGNRIFEDKNLLSLRKDRLLELVKPRKCVNNEIVFAWNKVNIIVVLFNIFEPANDSIRSGDIHGNVTMVSMNVQLGT